MVLDEAVTYSCKLERVLLNKVEKVILTLGKNFLSLTLTCVGGTSNMKFFDKYHAVAECCVFVFLSLSGNAVADDRMEDIFVAHFDQNSACPQFDEEYNLVKQRVTKQIDETSPSAMFYAVAVDDLAMAKRIYDARMLDGMEHIP